MSIFIPAWAFWILSSFAAVGAVVLFFVLVFVLINVALAFVFKDFPI